MNTFIERLTFLMNSKNLKRAVFCREVGISESTVRQWERGSVPNIDLAAKIAKFFNVTTDWLILGESPDGQIVQETKVTFIKDEEELLKTYRKLTEKQKASINDLLNNMV